MWPVRHTALVIHREDQDRRGHELWPPARLRLRTPRLELRLPDEDELARLAAVAAAGIHPPDVQPFGVPWGTQPSVLRARSVMQWHWVTRGTWSAGRWTLDFAVFFDGEPIGAHGLSATGFPVRREVATGSWLGHRYQRQGFGTEMRAAVLVLAFGYLGALSAVTGAFQDNAAAIGSARPSATPMTECRSPTATAAACWHTASGSPRRPTPGTGPTWR
jgi:RimJ/RimL family protein N-acetyltransferase